MAEARAGGAIHTGGEWSVGKTDCVVSSETDSGIVPGGDDVAYYGGYLVCESISPNNRPIVSAAPDMFDALLAIKEKLHFIGMPGEKVCKVTGKSDWSHEIQLLEAALKKAVTRVPVPIDSPVAAVDPDPDGVGAGYRKIGDDEVLIKGDEIARHVGRPDNEWGPITNNIGRVKSDSFISHCLCRRKIEPDVIDASFNVVPDAATECQKPPLGLMPRSVWLENRRDDIYDAIARYRAAGKDVSRDWLNELLDLDDQMRPF